MKITIDTDELKKQAAKGAGFIGKKAGELKNSADKVRKDVDDKINELDHELAAASTNYNDAYTLMSDHGMLMYTERCREIDLITNVEDVINSLANRPKEFDKNFTEIKTNREQFTGACDFAEREVQEARKAAGGAGAGLAAGSAVAFMGPSAAMWVATTFGTASTGVAISSLTGAAASNAALAWLGGGALAAGGGGIAAGNALLALAGPIGWTIAGASLLGSIIIYSKNKMKTNKEKSDEINKIRTNTETVRKTDAEVERILQESRSLRNSLQKCYHGVLSMYGRDYSSLSFSEKAELGSLVNNTLALSARLNEIIA